MVTLKNKLVVIFVVALVGFAQTTLADSTDATCEFYKQGEVNPNKSGPCTFSQRQGYVDIELRNGDTISLSPGNKPDHFKDQKGNKVERTHMGTDSHTYKWENKKITVKFSEKKGHDKHGHR